MSAKKTNEDKTESVFTSPSKPYSSENLMSGLLTFVKLRSGGEGRFLSNEQFGEVVDEMLAMNAQRLPFSEAAIDKVEGNGGQEGVSIITAHIMPDNSLIMRVVSYTAFDEDDQDEMLTYLRRLHDEEEELTDEEKTRIAELAVRSVRKSQ